MATGRCLECGEDGLHHSADCPTLTRPPLGARGNVSISELVEHVEREVVARFGARLDAIEAQLAATISQHEFDRGDVHRVSRAVSDHLERIEARLARIEAHHAWVQGEPGGVRLSGVPGTQRTVDAPPGDLRYRWSDGVRIHDAECWLTTHAGGGECTCWHSKVATLNAETAALVRAAKPGAHALSVGDDVRAHDKIEGADASGLQPSDTSKRILFHEVRSVAQHAGSEAMTRAMQGAPADEYIRQLRADTVDKRAESPRPRRRWWRLWLA